MHNLVGKVGAGVSLFLFAVPGPLAAGNAPAPPPQNPPPESSSAAPDHARAYYHYMLARRFKELAGIYNRSDYVERAISEYKQAMEADPESLFLRTELAELYWRVSRVGDAIREAEGVLKINPNQEDAHRLLGHIYLRNLGEAQPDKAAKESLWKAIDHFETLARLNPSDLDSYVILGRLYKLNNQPAKAEEVFKKVLNSEPASRNALASLAQLYTDQGDYDQAIDLLTKIPEGEMDSSLLGMLAYAYGQARQFDKGLTAFQKALAQDPENQDLHRMFAESLMSAGKSTEARAELQKIIKADPEDGQSVLRLAQIDRQEGKFDQARQDLERAKVLMQDNLEVPYQQALLEEDAGNEDKAIQILLGLLKQSEKPEGQYTLPESNNRAIFLERLGQIYRSQEKYDRAIEVFRQVVALGRMQAPRGEGLIIETLRLGRQAQKAWEEAEAAVQKYPEDRSLRILRASIAGERGRVEEAVQQLQALLNGTPADFEVQLAIAQVDSQAKRYAPAEEAVQKALRASSKPEDQERALFMLGSVFEREKRFDLAEEQFKKVLAANPLNAAAANYLGYMLADRGVRLEESVRYIQKALQLEPNNGAYLDSLGWAYFKLNKLDLAEVNLEKAARLITGDPTIHEHLGRLYLQMGKRVQAQQEWERALKEWPVAVSSDFDVEQASKLQKELDELKVRLAKEKPGAN